MSEADILAALKNVGVDTECGACMEVAFTGVTTNAHSCRHSLLLSVIRAELEQAHAAIDQIGAPRADGMGELSLSSRCWAVSNRWVNEQALSLSAIRALIQQLKATRDWGAVDDAIAKLEALCPAPAAEEEAR